jgi:hypothetical protein
MADPFAPSADPDIPTPKREDLLPHVHGSVRAMLAANKLDAAQTANEWSGARRIWDERHKEAAIKWREQTGTLGGASDMWFGHFYISHLDTDKRQHIREGDFTPQEIEMLAKGEDPWEQSRKPLPAGLEPPASLPPFDEWVRNVMEQFSPVAEKIRQAAGGAAKQSSRTPESDRDYMRSFWEKAIEAESGWRPSGWSDKALDWLEKQRAAGKTFKTEKEAEDAYVAGQRLPFANPPEWWTRRDRMERDTFIYGHPDPEDLAEEAAEKVRYQEAVAEVFERKRKELESEAAAQSKQTLPTLEVGQYPQGTVAHSATPVAEDTRSIVRPPDRKVETLEAKVKPETIADEPTETKSKISEPKTLTNIRQPALLEVLIYCWDTPHLYYIAGGFLVGGGIALPLSFWLMAELLFAIGIVLFVAKGIHALWGKENRLAIAAIFSVAGLIAIGFEVTLIEWKRSYDAQPVTSQPKASPMQIVDDQNTTLPLTPELQGTNAETRTIYNRVTTDIREALRDYQKTTGTSMYVVVPDMPTNLLSSEVLQYKGAVTFSQHAAWYIHLEKETSTYATLVVEFMNGDGTTVSGSGIGAVRFSYDPNSKTMNIAADGIGKAALGKAEEKMSASGFRAKSSEIVNSLFQYQLDHL